MAAIPPAVMAIEACIILELRDVFRSRRLNEESTFWKVLLAKSRPVNTKPNPIDDIT
jgi:hypothetical protein